MMTEIRISVLIATRNRSLSLARLINALSAQVDSPVFEVIVSDNGSSDDTHKVVKNARNRLQIHYVREERPGKSLALNAALKFARGELIIFTDDDVIPQPDWLSQLYSAAQRYPDVNIFGGQIDVNFEEVPSWIKRSFNLMGLLTSAHKHGDTDTPYKYGQYPFGPNMAIRRHLLTGHEDPYPVHLGPGTDCPVGDESVFFMKFSPPAARDRIFVPSARVFHEVEQENINFHSAIRRCYIAGRGQSCLRLPALSKSPEVHSSTFGLILARTSSCKSFRELICISARYIGFLVGSSKLFSHL